MGRHRGKLIPRYIENCNTRRSTFAKRNKSLKKKISEFSTLCDVDACLISYGRDKELEVWPEDEGCLHRIIQRYLEAAKNKQERNKEDLTKYLKENQKAVEEELQQTRKANEESERELLGALEDKMQKVAQMIVYLRSRCAGGGGVQNQFQQNFCHGGGYGNPMYQSLMLPQPLPIQSFQPAMFGRVEGLPDIVYDNVEPQMFGQSCLLELAQQPQEFPSWAPFDNNELAFFRLLGQA